MAKLERVAAFKINPTNLKIIGVDKYDANHPLYDARVTREVQPELVSAVGEFGVLKPVIVSKEDVTGDYLVVDGRQRVRAARLANEKRAEKGQEALEVPFIVREGDVASLLAVAAAANVNMEETMLDRALRVDHMIKQGMKRSAIAASFGVSEMAISNWLKLLKVDNQVLSALAQGAIGATTALKFAALPSEKQVAALHEAVPSLKPAESAPAAPTAQATEAAAAPTGTESLPAAASEPQKVSGRSAASAIAAVATEEPTFIAPTIGELKRVYSVNLKRITEAAKKEGTKAKLPSWMAVLRFIVEGKEEAAPDLAAAIKMLRAAKADKASESETEDGVPPADAPAEKPKKEKVAKVTDAEKASALEKIKAQAAAARAAAAAVQPLTPTVAGVPVDADDSDDSDDADAE